MVFPCVPTAGNWKDWRSIQLWSSSIHATSMGIDVMDFLVKASNLHKHFGSTHAVDGISLQVGAGEIYGLVGSDGAGKTTTLRLLVGALLPNEGEIQVCGFDVRRQVEGARSQIGYLSQRFSMYEDLTVLENIRFFAEVRG
ncbi:MAG: ATP-binding cassette domain-containing protein, partial [Chloroflexi bacterium]|nr:ATP-binding cassette domain-containing protein [Chloroflexota bacterium]